MDWEDTLIDLYCKICGLWTQGLDVAAERMSPNQAYDLTDQEVMTIYLFGTMEGHSCTKKIYTFTTHYLKGWFPHLGTYKSFNHRLSKIHICFQRLVELLSDSLFKVFRGAERTTLLGDSMPIMMAKQSRSGNAKVARQEADKGYCSSKDEYYYGVKLHILGCKMPGTLPMPSIFQITKASEHDLTASRPVFQQLHGVDIYLDKAFCDKKLTQELLAENNTTLHTPIKTSKTKKRLDLFEQIYSSGVSSIRQPIESLNNWLIEKTGIQIASKVRAYKGLMIHVFGKIAAALILLPKLYQAKSI